MATTYTTPVERNDAEDTLKKLLALPAEQRLIAVGVIEGMSLAHSTNSKPDGETA